MTQKVSGSSNGSRFVEYVIADPELRGANVKYARMIIVGFAISVANKNTIFAITFYTEDVS